MRVSVVVNNFNYARFLADAINSALDQTWPDTEVVVVDDGSTDDSRQVIAAFGDKVRTVLKDNGGQGSAYNAGFAAATGDAIIFLDADDTLLPTTVEQVATAFQTHPDAGKVQYRLAEVDADLVPTGGHKPPLDRHMPSGDLRQQVLRHHSYWWPPATGNAYTRTVLERMLPLEEQILRIESDAFLANASALLAPVVSLPEVLGRLRIHGANAFHVERPPLDQATLHHDLRRAQEHRAVVYEFALRNGLAGYPASALDLRSSVILSKRLVSLKLYRSTHPYEGDTLRAAAVAAVSGALRTPNRAARERIRHVTRLLAIAAAPRPIARRLSTSLLGGVQPTTIGGGRR